MSGGPLRGRTVVLTRPRPRAGALARELRRRGARVAFAPLIRSAPPRSWRALDAALRSARPFDAAAFASARAAEAFFERARRVLSRAPRPPALVAAVGPATAAALAARGWRAGVVAAERRAEGLAAALRLPRGARVLLPRAEAGRETLPRLLRRAGLKVTAAAAYRTLDDAAGQKAFRGALARGADAACFASGSAVASAARALRPVRLSRGLGACRAVAIGPTTAAALSAAGVRPAAVAASPEPAALAAAVARALAGRRA